MVSVIVSPAAFLVVLSCFAIGGIGALVFRKNDAAANYWGSSFAIAGSGLGLLLACSALTTGHVVLFRAMPSFFPLLSLSCKIDALSAFFVLVISLIALCSSIYGVGYVKHYYGKYDIGSLGFFYNAFIMSMLLVVSADNGLLFLIAWEIMSLASYFLVIYERDNPGNVKAGSLYFSMTHVGTAFIVFAFLLFYKYTGSFDFETVKAHIGAVPMVVRSVIFVVALIGFGVKAGMIPLHIWLPSAHPAAPSHVSALMSGVMIKTGIYMMIRIFFDVVGDPPLWWGFVLLTLGSISSLLGVLYALAEHDIKRLLAYHSIENIGIILLGIGSALAFSALHMPSFALIGLVAALFHTLNHAAFKSLLFLSAGSVISQTHTRNIEEYGGLIKCMPQTALFFLVGSMAISALPPLNGFFSEWLTFQSLFRGVASLDPVSKWIFIASAGSLAFTGGLALACFVKAFGATFLARPRSVEAAGARESSSSLRWGMALLAIACLLLGLCSGYVTSLLGRTVESFTGFANNPSMISIAAPQLITIGNGFSSVSAPVILLVMIFGLGITAFAVTNFVHRRQKIRIGATWDCGTRLTPRMEITATGFSRSIIMIFRGFLKPSKQSGIEYDDADMRYFPKPRAVVLGVRDMYRLYIYEPLRRLITMPSEHIKKIQSGNINAYVLYMFIALLALLLLTVR